MIASRNIDRLRETADELVQQLPKDGGPKLDYTMCNIREEDQVAIEAFVPKFHQLNFIDQILNFELEQ